MSDAAEAIRAVDKSNQLDDVLALPDHLHDALWRVESAGIEPGAVTGLVMCGMGGSAIGARLARAAFGDRLTAPMLLVQDYELAPWTPADYAVLCSSYSGSTEETLACFAAAEALGVRRIVATTGGRLAESARAAGVPVVGIPSGLQPRAAVGYVFTIAAEVAAMLGVADALRTEIDSSAAHLEHRREALLERSASLADDLEGSVPAIYGSDLTAPVALRWKTQMNEQAKILALWGELPEIDHNEIEGWTGAGEDMRFSAVFLEDRDQHPRQRERAELTAKLIEPEAASVVMIETEGETRTERMLWAVMLGDLVSLQLAARRGIDPGSVPVIERLKDELGRP
jgi:glucose/mannose-6-phosphate isomerase